MASPRRPQDGPEAIDAEIIETTATVLSPEDPVGIQSADTMSASPELAAKLRHQLELDPDAFLPSLDDFLSHCGVLGSPEDLAWLVAVCCRPGESRAQLNLGRIRQHLQGLEEERRTGTAKLMQQARELKKAPAGGTLSLDQAADLFYRHCYPDVQECLDIATEQLQQPRARIILAALGHYKDDLHGVDVTNALEVEDMVQQAPRGNVTPFPVASSVGFQHRECPICLVAFQPHKDKPKQLYCADTCGNFAYALQTWATNAATYADMRSLPQPDPFQHGVPLDRRDPALAWQAREAPAMLEQAERRLSEMRMRAQ